MQKSLFLMPWGFIAPSHTHSTLHTTTSAQRVLLELFPSQFITRNPTILSSHATRSHTHSLGIYFAKNRFLFMILHLKSTSHTHTTHSLSVGWGCVILICRSALQMAHSALLDKGSPHTNSCALFTGFASYKPLSSIQVLSPSLFSLLPLCFSNVAICWFIELSLTLSHTQLDHIAL